MNIDIIKLKMVKEDSVKYDARRSISAPENAYEVAKEMGMDENAEEEFWIMCLDMKNKPCGLHMISRGNLNSSIVHPREVFKRAMLNNAASIMLFHNHPSGDPEPSAMDVEITKRLRDAGDIMGIRVLDHLIIGDGTYCSLTERGLVR